jgi:hypothetical protein
MGHATALFRRPVRTSRDLPELSRVENVVAQLADLVVAHGGSLSGEHGDGQSRAELLPKMFGDGLVRAFGEFKAIWDPERRMNPNKVVDHHYRLQLSRADRTERRPPDHALRRGARDRFGAVIRRGRCCPLLPTPPDPIGALRESPQDPDLFTPRAGLEPATIRLTAGRTGIMGRRTVSALPSLLVFRGSIDSGKRRRDTAILPHLAPWTT